MGRLFKQGKRLFIVPMDHGITSGPLGGLEDISKTVKQVSEGGADAVIVHKGLARYISSNLAPVNCELIIHLSASTSLAADPSRKELVSSVEQAIRLGAAAASIHVNLGTPSEPQMLKDLGWAAEQCDRWGLPMLAMMYVKDGKPESEYDAGKIRHAARIAEELGADIIKVNYTATPDTFSMVTSSVKSPVIIAGGPKADSPDALYRMIKEAVAAGARGAAIGRNVFGTADPVSVSRTIRRILDNEIQ